MHAGLRVKCSILTEIGAREHIFAKLPNTKFHENSFSNSRVTIIRTDRHGEAKLLGAFFFLELLLWNAKKGAQMENRFLKQLEAAWSKVVTWLSYFFTERNEWFHFQDWKYFFLLLFGMHKSSFRLYCGGCWVINFYDAILCQVTSCFVIQQSEGPCALH